MVVVAVGPEVRLEVEVEPGSRGVEVGVGWDQGSEEEGGACWRAGSMVLFPKTSGEARGGRLVASRCGGSLPALLG